MRRARYRLLDRGFLDAIYDEFHHAGEIGFDPIRFVLPFSSPQDQEVMGLVSACMAYGHVKQISASMEILSKAMGANPGDWLLNADASTRARALPEFRHRWTSREDILWLWERMHHVLVTYGSLEGCFSTGLRGEKDDFVQGLNTLVDALEDGASGVGTRVLSKPAKGSACKRMVMYMRWMIRRDAVDPGPWSGVDPSVLMMPVDTHIFQTATGYHLTRRNSVNWKTVEEITSHFRAVNPEDPVRYDFALTRLGMRGPGSLDRAVENYWMSAG